MTTNTTKYPITAVSGELVRGNEWTVYSPVWFLEKDGEKFWTYKQPWTVEDLRKVDPWSADEYLWGFEEGASFEIREGECFYLMGPIIHQVLTKLIDGDVFTFSLHPWKPALHGYYGVVMTPAAFTALAKELSVKIWDVMTKKKDDFLELEVSPENLYQAYRSFAHYAKIDKHLVAAQEGAFFKHFKDQHSYEIFTYLAVNIDGLYADKEEYTEAVEKVLQEMEPSQNLPHAS